MRANNNKNGEVPHGSVIIGKVKCWAKTMFYLARVVVDSRRGLMILVLRGDITVGSTPTVQRRTGRIACQLRTRRRRGRFCTDHTTSLSKAVDDVTFSHNGANATESNKTHTFREVCQVASPRGRSLLSTIANLLEQVFTAQPFSWSSQQRARKNADHE